MRTRRTVTLINGTNPAKRSKRRLWAFSVDTIAHATGQSSATVRRHIADGRLSPTNLRGVACYVAIRTPD